MNLHLIETNCVGDKVLEHLQNGKIIEAMERFFKFENGKIYYSDNTIQWHESMIPNTILITTKFNIFEVIK